MTSILKFALIAAVGVAAVTGCGEKERGARSETPTGKERIEKVAREPEEMVDEFIAKMEADHQLKEYDLKVSVTKEGKMMITGQVPTADLKKKAERLAGTVMGVRSVENDIAVIGGRVTERDLSDGALRREMEKKIKADSELNEYPISVDVEKRKAIIEGFVQTQEERRKVLVLAETVAGFTEIDSSDIRLADELKDEFTAKIRADNQLQDYKIEAWMEKGNILNISGRVPNKEYRRKVESLARTVAGVTKIRNQVKVSAIEFPPEKVLTDKQLKSEIERKIAADSELKKYDISVAVDKGEATLKGSVESRSDRRKAAKLAETVKGVSRIENEIRREKEVASDNKWRWPRASAEYVNNLL
ncbi:MAG: BON domain-containing protein [Planctomycetes bacterium]|nr:BON domain-containing protein [Planctomycetota bacterium]